jgi:myxalamid-type polyketide synthase MxaB
LRGQIAARLDVHPEEVDPRGQLIALGMSSLKAVELKTQLESEFELSLRSSLMFDYPTLELLVPFVLQRLRLAEAPGESPPPREPQRPVAHAERPQDAASALAAELEDLLQEG